jgi:hypothetical protein
MSFSHARYPLVVHLLHISVSRHISPTLNLAAFNPCPRALHLHKHHHQYTSYPWPSSSTSASFASILFLCNVAKHERCNSWLNYSLRRSRYEGGVAYSVCLIARRIQGNTQCHTRTEPVQPRRTFAESAPEVERSERQRSARMKRYGSAEKSLEVVRGYTMTRKNVGVYYRWYPPQCS